MLPGSAPGLFFLRPRAAGAERRGGAVDPAEPEFCRLLELPELLEPVRVPDACELPVRLPDGTALRPDDGLLSAMNFYSSLPGRR